MSPPATSNPPVADAISSDEDSIPDPSTKGKGKSRGRKSEYLTDAMDEEVVATFDAFAKIILARPLMTKEDREFIRVWKGKNANALLDALTGAFVGCIVQGDSQRSRSAWYRRIYLMYDNHYRYHYKQQIEANIQAHANTNGIAQPVSAPIDSAHEAETFKTIRGTWLRVIGKTSARDVFAEMNPDIITLKKQEIQAEDGNKAFGGGLHNAAVSRAWGECEDKEVYENKAVDVKGSIDETRKWLPFLMQTATRDLLRRKTVGSAAIKVYMAWRLNDGSVSTSIAGAAYDAGQDLELQFPLADLDVQRVAWGQEAHNILPRLTIPSHPSSTSASAADGPRWTADVKRASPEQVVQATRDHIEQLWVHSFGAQRPIPAVPYNDIVQYPNQFYDTAVHTLPNGHLDMSLDDVLGLYSLASYLESQSTTTNPFRFLPARLGNTQPQPPDDTHPLPQGLTQATNGNIAPMPPPPTHQAPAPIGDKVPVPPPPSPPLPPSSPTIHHAYPGEVPKPPAEPSNDKGPKAAKSRKKQDRKDKKEEKKKGKGEGRKNKRKRAAEEDASTNEEPPAKKAKEGALDTIDTTDHRDAIGNQPPKHKRSAKKAVANDENAPPSQNEEAGPSSLPSRRQPKRPTAPKPRAPPSKRTKVSDRFYTIVEPIRQPTPPLPM